MVASVVRLKVTLDHVEPIVMRRVVVPFTLRLSRLHEVLQAAMGWTNSHLYEFRIRDVGFGLPDEQWGDGPIDARRVSLLSAVQDTGAKSFKYLYDFGDGWEHSIKIERTFPAIGTEGPMLLEATGHCPPEDVGGPWGYQEFREALADPAHERHAEILEWLAEVARFIRTALCGFIGCFRRCLCREGNCLRLFEVDLIGSFPVKR